MFIKSKDQFITEYTANIILINIDSLTVIRFVWVFINISLCTFNIYVPVLVKVTTLMLIKLLKI
jgi:hypothetical protein